MMSEMVFSLLDSWVLKWPLQIHQLSHSFLCHNGLVIIVSYEILLMKSYIIINLKLFPKIWINYYKEISNCLYTPTSCFFLYFFPIAHSNFYIISNLVYPSDFGSSSWSLSLHFCVQYFLKYLYFLICITCPNYLNLLFWMSFFISSALSPILY